MPRLDPSPNPSRPPRWPDDRRQHAKPASRARDQTPDSRPRNRLDSIAAQRREPNVHVVIVGCGRVGSELAASLERMDHTVSVVDMEPRAFQRWGDLFKGDKVVGRGYDRDALAEAGIERAGA